MFLHWFLGNWIWEDCRPGCWFLCLSLLDRCFVLVFSIYFFWPKWPRILVSGKSSHPVEFLTWDFWAFECLDSVWPNGPMESAGVVGKVWSQEVSGVGQRNESWGSRIQWVVAVRLTGWSFVRAVEFHQIWGQGLSALLILRWEGKGHILCPGFRVWRLGQLSWEVNHSPVVRLVWVVPVSIESVGVWRLSCWQAGRNCQYVSFYYRIQSIDIESYQLPIIVDYC